MTCSTIGFCGVIFGGIAFCGGVKPDTLPDVVDVADSVEYISFLPRLTAGRSHPMQPLPLVPFCAY